MFHSIQALYIPPFAIPFCITSKQLKYEHSLVSSGQQLQFSRYLRNLVALGTFLNFNDEPRTYTSEAIYYRDTAQTQAQQNEINNDELKVIELLENMSKLNQIVLSMNDDDVHKMYDDLLVDWFQKNTTENLESCCCKRVLIG